MSKAKRKGRMFIDYLRNGQGATAICPWSTLGATRSPPGVPSPLPGTNSRGFKAELFDVFAAAARAQQAGCLEGLFRGPNKP